MGEDGTVFTTPPIENAVLPHRKELWILILDCGSGQQPVLNQDFWPLVSLESASACQALCKQRVPSFPPTNHPSSGLPKASALQFPGSLSQGGSQELPISHLSRPHPSYLGFTVPLLPNYAPLPQVFILPLQTPLSSSGSLLSLSHHSNSSCSPDPGKFQHRVVLVSSLLGSSFLNFIMHPALFDVVTH